MVKNFVLLILFLLFFLLWLSFLFRSKHISIIDKNKGAKFLKKVWCCIGGVTKSFVFINLVDNVNWLPQRVSKLSFRALALCQSEERRTNDEE